MAQRACSPRGDTPEVILMGKNILLFVDGTGNEGGLLPDESRTNVYKLFAGNHSDIGGSYPENESRLSDISVHWMANLITKKLPERARVLIQSELLQCFPSADGMMHDELMAGVGSHHLHIFVRGDRRVDPGGTLHRTVIERLEMESVRNYIGFGLYRPESLQDHPAAREYYPNPQDTRG
jgi:hypothetical protein